MNKLQIAFTLIGLYLIIEGFGSFVLFAEQIPILEAGRILRIFFGIFIIRYAVKMKG